MILQKIDYLQSDPLAVMSDFADAPTARQYEFLQKSGNAQAMPEYTDSSYEELPWSSPIIDIYTRNPSEEDTPLIPNVLSDNNGIYPIDLTDKNSRGIFEQTPVVRSDSVLAPTEFKNFDSNPIDPNMTALNDPAAMALQTFATGTQSPLQQNLNQDSAFLSGTDPLPVSAGDMQQTQDAAVPYEDRKPSDCSWYDFACKWESVNQEVYLFIIGAIILAIGIYALTKS